MAAAGTRAPDNDGVERARGGGGVEAEGRVSGGVRESAGANANDRLSEQRFERGGAGLRRISFFGVFPVPIMSARGLFQRN